METAKAEPMFYRRVLPFLLLLLAIPACAQISTPTRPAPEAPVPTPRFPSATRPACLTPWLLGQEANRAKEERDPLRNIESAPTTPGAGQPIERETDRDSGYDMAPTTPVEPPTAASSALPFERESRQKFLVTPQGHFRIHYDISGSNAVKTRDDNANGIPDYIDSTSFYLEYAWRVEIEELGYTPPTDKGIQGPEVDVLVSGLDTYTYGYAYPEFENEISSSPLRVTGFLVIDNDYIGYPTSGIAGLRVTTAHEFHHIVQFSSYRVETSQAALYEATSTWFEKVVHPSIRDYRLYTDVLLAAPQQCPFSTHDVSNMGIGYGHVLYLDYLSERIDRGVIRRIWEEFGRDERSFTAIDMAIRATSRLNLEQSWCEFARWCYYTGSRAPADSSLLDEAKSLPTMGMADVGSLEISPSVTLDGELQPLAFTVERVRIAGIEPGTSDSIDFLVANTRSDIGKGGPQVPYEPFTLRVARSPGTGYLPLLRKGVAVAYYRFASPSPFYCVTPIVGGSDRVSAVEEERDRIPTDGGTGARSRRTPSLNLHGE